MTTYAELHDRIQAMARRTRRDRWLHPFKYRQRLEMYAALFAIKPTFWESNAHLQARTLDKITARDERVHGPRW